MSWKFICLLTQTPAQVDVLAYLLFSQHRNPKVQALHSTSHPAAAPAMHFYWHG